MPYDFNGINSKFILCSLFFPPSPQKNGSSTCICKLFNISLEIMQLMNYFPIAMSSLPDRLDGY